MKHIIEKFRAWRLKRQEIRAAREAERAVKRAKEEAERLRRDAELSAWTREQFRQLPVERGPYVPEDRLEYDPFM